MTFTTDNRWSAGSLQDKVPDAALAAYGARWIDYSTYVDIVPDRQGFAYDKADQRDLLIALMEHVDLRTLATELPWQRDDAPVEVADTDIEMDGAYRWFHAWMRRSGGYVYVAAWYENTEEVT